MTLTALQDAALDMLRKERMKRVPLNKWMREVHHNTRKALTDKGIVTYLPERDGITPLMFATLVIDPHKPTE